jgi:hypothetical protein
MVVRREGKVEMEHWAEGEIPKSGIAPVEVLSDGVVGAGRSWKRKLGASCVRGEAFRILEVEALDHREACVPCEMGVHQLRHVLQEGGRRDLWARVRRIPEEEGRRGHSEVADWDVRIRAEVLGWEVGLGNLLEGLSWVVFGSREACEAQRGVPRTYLDRSRESDQNLEQAGKGPWGHWRAKASLG